jgi:predicted lipid-binding transport protein (Tim44 family)
MYWGEGLTLIGLALWWITPKLKRNKSVEEQNFEEGEEVVKDGQKTLRPRTTTDETPTVKKIVSPVSTTQRLNPNFSVIETTKPDETT